MPIIKKQLSEISDVSDVSRRSKLETLVDIAIARNFNINVKSSTKSSEYEIKFMVLDSIFKIYFPSYYVLTDEKFLLTTESEKTIIENFIKGNSNSFKDKNLSIKLAIEKIKQLIIFKNKSDKKFYLLYADSNNKDINLIGYLLKKYICDGNS